MKTRITLLAWIIALTANAAIFKADGINYKTTSSSTVMVMPNSSYSDDGDVVIGLNNGYPGDVIIPETVTYDGVTYTVTAVEDETFSYSTKLTSVSLPATVQRLGEAPFAACNKLTAIYVDGASPYFKSIDGVLFDKDVTMIIACPAIKEGAYSVPSTVKKVGNSAFYGCSRLTAITLPNGVTEIGEGAFRSCLKMQSINIPDGISIIPASMLRSCASLKTITIPSGVESIDHEAFSYCQSLKEIILPASVTTVGAKTFDHCISLTAISFPEGVTSIGDQVMNNCMDLTTVSLPASLQYLGTGPFRVCRSLSQINLAEGNTHFVCDEGVLLDAAKTKVICCPAVKSGEYKVPETVTDIDDFSFYYCERLTGISLPKHLKTIGIAAFAYCVGLTSLNIPAEVNYIGISAFSSCEQLKDIVCQATTPPSMPKDAFSSYQVTLYVPASSKSLYTSADFWKNLADFKGVGDVNSDERVNVVDVMALVNSILGQPTVETEEKVCDVNYDGKVGVADVMLLVKICLGDEP